MHRNEITEGLPDIDLDQLAQGLTLKQVSAYLNEHLPEEIKARLIYEIAKNADGVRFILDWLEIQNTPSAFDDPSDPDKKKSKELEGIAANYSYRDWLSEQNIKPHEATRDHIMAWWDFFKNRCKDRGYTPSSINRAGHVTDLWKATCALAQKMERDQKKYGYLPAHLVNQPEVVAKALLRDIEDPEAWLEVLVGETIEDMLKSESFLEAFSTTNKDVPVREKATASVELVLGKDKFPKLTK